MPSNLKWAAVTPLLKKARMDEEDIRSYRPISNLPFLSNLIERDVERRIENHIRVSDHHDRYQSAYCKDHSTETALIEVHSDISDSLDEGSMATLVLFDSSAVFDIIDHSILITRLQYTFGIEHEALPWIESSLSDRFQHIVIAGCKSADSQLAFRVPQGSILRPKMYCMYTNPPGEIIKRHGLKYHSYADDSQVYMKLKRADNMDEAVHAMEDCLADISTWIVNNLLKLNQNKTELTVFSSKQSTNKIRKLRLKVGSSYIESASSVRNLGIILDNTLEMEKQVNAICKSGYYQIPCIGSIRPYITNEACTTLVQALVISRFDYGNALLYDISPTLFSLLQRIQNCAARLVMRTRNREQVTLVLLTKG